MGGLIVFVCLLAASVAGPAGCSGRQMSPSQTCLLFLCLVLDSGRSSVQPVQPKRRPAAPVWEQLIHFGTRAIQDPASDGESARTRTSSKCHQIHRGDDDDENHDRNEDLHREQRWLTATARGAHSFSRRSHLDVRSVPTYPSS